MKANTRRQLAVVPEAPLAPGSRVQVPERYRHLLAADPRCYLCTIRGTSMNPELVEGDIALVSPNADPVNGEYVVLYNLDDNDGFIKRLRCNLPRFILPQNIGPGSNVTAHIELEMTNPPRRLTTRGDRWKAIYAIVGIIKRHELAGLRVEPAKGGRVRGRP